VHPPKGQCFWFARFSHVALSLSLVRSVQEFRFEDHRWRHTLYPLIRAHRDVLTEARRVFEAEKDKVTKPACSQTYYFFSCFFLHIKKKIRAEEVARKKKVAVRKVAVSLSELSSPHMHHLSNHPALIRNPRTTMGCYGSS
jgi:hypothetical protein